MDEKEIILKKSVKLEGTKIKGYDLDNGFDFDAILKNYLNTGFQATEIAKAIKIWQEFEKEKNKKDLKVFLSFTSNAISSGIREYIKWLTKYKKVDVIITSGGGIEEDIIKLLDDFVLGKWVVNDLDLREKGINRIGNIFVANECYIKFEKFMTKFFEKLLKQKQIWNPMEFIRELGKEVSNLKNKEESYIYWAYKNNIPVFSMNLIDGSIGDMLYFFNKNKKEKLIIDIASDDIILKEIAINAEKTAGIILGGATPKHHLINTNLFREGLDYAIYITTANYWDGSLSGAQSSEATSWGKIQKEHKTVDIFADFTIVFPLIIYGAFKDSFK